VPFILVAPDDHRLWHAPLRQGGRLSAVAPTLLALMGIAVPDSMTEPALVLER
jgi:bisphosphoglycerate-independent phosphoglycerate mutase (AlkP superfamily)